jgi:hypothetical protein
MHRKTMIVKMEQRRRRIKFHVSSRRPIMQSGKAICPRIEKWNPGSASFSLQGFQILDAAQQFLVTIAERSAQHSGVGPELRAKVSFGQSDCGLIIHQMRALTELWVNKRSLTRTVSNRGA